MPTDVTSVGAHSLPNSTRPRSNDASSHSVLDSYTNLKKYQGFSAEKLLRGKRFCDRINMYFTVFAFQTKSKGQNAYFAL